MVVSAQNWWKTLQKFEHDRKCFEKPTKAWLRSICAVTQRCHGRVHLFWTRDQCLTKFEVFVSFCVFFAAFSTQKPWRNFKAKICATVKEF